MIVTVPGKGVAHAQKLGQGVLKRVYEVVWKGNFVYARKRYQASILRAKEGYQAVDLLYENLCSQFVALEFLETRYRVVHKVH
jgi:DNA-binding helix-hairpin-helix protein with protein kinase domain